MGFMGWGAAKDVRAKELGEKRKWKCETGTWWRSGRQGFEMGYTGEISTKVHWLSITFLLAFEWGCKVLKKQRVGNSKAEIRNLGRRCKPGTGNVANRTISLTLAASPETAAGTTLLCTQSRMARLMKFTVKVMLVAYDELIESREHEITADNQVAAIRKELEAEGPIELQPSETLVVFAIPQEQKTVEDPGGVDFTSFPHPKRDDRDPYGRIERQMLRERCGSDDHEAREKYRQEHPEFATEYEAELRRRSTLNN